MRSLIIHMQGDTKRHKNAQRLMGILPDARIVDAVIGKDVMANTSMANGSHHAPHYPFPLGAGEVGCFLSHRKCWQQIVDTGLNYALIAEDDLDIDPAFWPDVLDLITDHCDADSYIRLPAKQREKPAGDVVQNGKARLFMPRVIGLQTVFQVVGYNAAKRLLQASKVLDRPVDAFIQMHWVTDQPALTIVPNGIRELTEALGGSTIQRKTRTSGKLARELKRVWYRAQIARRPQKA